MTQREPHPKLPPCSDLLDAVGSPPLGYSTTRPAFPSGKFTAWNTTAKETARQLLSPPSESQYSIKNNTHGCAGSDIQSPLLATDTNVSAVLRVPFAAGISAGGWFDPSDWIFKLAYQRVGHQSIDDLMKTVYHREDRPRYGEDHTSTRSKNPKKQSIALCPVAVPLDPQQLSTDAHKQQEQDRRWRHRTLQCANDDCTGTFVANLAEQALPLIKETINQMSRKEIVSQDTDRKVKRIGKDEQLAAAVLNTHTLSILVFKLHDALKTLTSRCSQRTADLDHERGARMIAEEGLDELRHENGDLSRELSHLQSKHRTISRKRPAECMDDKASEIIDCDQSEKRWPQLNTSIHRGNRHGGYQLPLSPRSDEEGYITSFQSG